MKKFLPLLLLPGGLLVVFLVWLYLRQRPQTASSPTAIKFAGMGGGGGGSGWGGGGTTVLKQGGGGGGGGGFSFGGGGGKVDLTSTIAAVGGLLWTGLKNGVAAIGAATGDSTGVQGGGFSWSVQHQIDNFGADQSGAVGDAKPYDGGWQNTFSANDGFGTNDFSGYDSNINSDSFSSYQSDDYGGWGGGSGADTYSGGFGGDYSGGDYSGGDFSGGGDAVSSYGDSAFGGW